MNKVCIDACIAIKWLVPEEGSLAALELLTNWVAAGTQIVAPHLLPLEVFSTIRRLQHSGLLSSADGHQVLSKFCKIKIDLLFPPNLLDEALELATRFNRPTVYDTCYLALAQLTGCELWTADERLLNSLGGKLPRVHRL